jgi:hypothetical protein
MVANTDRMARLISLCGSAIELAQRGNRTPDQIDNLIHILQKFKGLKSGKPDPNPAKKITYPGRNGNRCCGCGGWIDEGGFCPGGTNHSDQSVISAACCRN